MFTLNLMHIFLIFLISNIAVAATKTLSDQIQAATRKVIITLLANISRWMQRTKVKVYRRVVRHCNQVLAESNRRQSNQ